MRIGVPREPEFENRVGIVPGSMKKLTKAGFELMIESSAGKRSHHDDADYEKAGANIGSEVRYSILTSSYAYAYHR